jgi:O-antigen/teichoic acid export membrane protein
MPDGTNELTLPAPRLSFVQRIWTWLRRVLGLDRAIGFTVLARFWSSSAGLVTVTLIARFLSPPEQGFYYTFGSLVALQIVFELGFSYVVMQVASHERAHIAISRDFQISGDGVAHARLASVIQRSVRWYSVAAFLMAVTLVPAGFWFFGSHPQRGADAVAWRLPWCAVALAATLNFQLDPILSFFEGCGYVADVARLRLTQSATGSVLAWMALISGHGLFAPSMMLLGMASAALLWLVRKRKLLLGLLRHKPGEHGIEWAREVWPFQWRIALSWLSGYFIFQLFNPVLFAYRGPVAAGQMGMSLSLVNALQAVAVSWVSTKAAPFGGLIAKRDFSQLDRLFFAAARQAVGVCIVGALVVWLGCVYLNAGHYKFAQRLLGPSLLAVMLVSATLNIMVIAQAYYLRAHKEEKFLLNSVVGAIGVAISTILLGKRYGAAGMVIGYCALNVCGLGWATQVFVKYRRIWHEAKS